MKKVVGNLQISGKLFLSPLVGILFLTALAIVSYIGLSFEKKAIVDIYTNRFKSYQDCSRIINDIANVHANLYGVLSWTSANYEQQRIDNLSKDQLATLDRNIDVIKKLLASNRLNEAEAKLYRASLEQLGEYRKSAFGVIDLATADIGMANTYMSLADSKFQTLNKDLQDLLKLEDSLSKESYDRSLYQFNVTFAVFVTLFIVAIVLSIFTGIFILRKMVISPIISIAKAAQKISEGDLTFDVEAKGGDEIGRMILLLKESFQSLGGILMSIKELSGRISKVVEDVERESQRVVKGAEVETDAIVNISNSVEEMNATVIEISGNTENLVVSTQQTSASIEEMMASIKSINDNIRELSTEIESTSSSIQELSASINEVATNADELSKSSEDTLSAISEITAAIKEVEGNAKESAAQSQRVASDAATIGMTSVEKTIEGMKNIQSSVEQTAEFIKTLGKRSEEIGMILNVIEDITEETGLLALNASILAAQAGEHGRGFSVVANEIKDLATKTSNSTKEIATLIHAVRQDVKNVAEAVQKGIGSVQEGFSLSKNAGDALNKILESSKSSSSMAALIERSTTEQARAARLVVSAMERMRDMTGHIAQATAEQSKGAVQISKATEKMRTVSRQVSKTTQEQAVTSKQITDAVENVSDRSEQIARSLTEHKKGSKNILQSIEGVKSVPEENRNLAFRISKTLRDLQKDSELLKKEMERFRFNEKKTVAEKALLPR
jgi:methyl-accepting chemotaxis protein